MPAPRAFREANGRIAGFLDADLSTPPEYILKAYDAIRSGACDAFIGSRRSAESKVTRKQFFLKSMLGDAFRFCAKQVFFRGGPVYQDSQCGFKFFETRVASVWFVFCLLRPLLGFARTDIVSSLDDLSRTIELLDVCI